MKGFKENLIAKTAAFIGIVICSVIVVLSAAVVYVNTDYQWYSKSEEKVMNDIYESTSSYTANNIEQQLFMYVSDVQEENDEAYALVGEEIELIEHENDAESFGYIVSSNMEQLMFENGEEKESTRAVNDGIGKDPNVFSEKYHHTDVMDIEIFLGEITWDSVPEMVYMRYDMTMKMYQYRTAALIAMIAGIIFAIGLLVYLLSSAGHSSSENLFLPKLPVEFLVLLFGAAVAAVLVIIDQSIYWTENLDPVVFIISVSTAVIVTVFLAALTAGVIKAKQHTLWNSSILYYLFRMAKWLFAYIKKGCLWVCAKCSAAFRMTGCGMKKIPVVWKTAAAVVIGIIINLFITVQLPFNDGMWFMWLVGAIITFVVIVYCSLNFYKLRKGCEHLAAGELDYQIDKKGMILEFADHADDLNNIAAGMTKAVEEKMRSEHFKTELITNVSHDIKTPLTSIINYIDFLKKEDIDNEKAGEYIEIIDRQSQRLRKLTEDLVEASKAATGNIKLDLMPCNAGMLMKQIAGECEDRLDKADLKLVSKIPDEEIRIMADSRSMWRILDNVMNNICKYSQPGTRVYQTLEAENGKVMFVYKNVSRYELNITGEELMERFVRGDSSRHTEGSGLGLSIAKNLTELQNGKFDIFIDGDLFKVIVEFDSIN